MKRLAKDEDTGRRERIDFYLLASLSVVKVQPDKSSATETSHVPSSRYRQ